MNEKIFGIGQSISAITKAVSDGDMTPEDAGTLSDLLEQSVAKQTPANLEQLLAVGSGTGARRTFGLHLA